MKIKLIDINSVSSFECKYFTKLFASLTTQAGNQRSGYQNSKVPGECFLPGLQRAIFLLRPHIVERELASYVAS